MRVEQASDRRRPALVLATIVAVILMVAGLALVSAKAFAAPVLPGDPNPQPGAPGYLKLVETPSPLMFQNMSPGQVGYGEIEVTLEGAESAELNLEMYAGGELLDHPNGVTMSIAVCDAPWSGLPDQPVTSEPIEPGCSAGEQLISAIGPGESSDGTPLFDLGTLTNDTPRFIMVEVRMPDVSFSRDESLMGLSGDFAFHVIAQGDDSIPTTTPPSTTPSPGTPGVAAAPGMGSGSGTRGPGGLANTGLDVLAVALLASGAIALGAITRYRRSFTPRRSAS